MVAAYQVHQHSTRNIPACTGMTFASEFGLIRLKTYLGPWRRFAQPFLRTRQLTSTCFVKVHIDALQLQVAVTLRTQHTSDSTLRICV